MKIPPTSGYSLRVWRPDNLTNAKQSKKVFLRKIEHAHSCRLCQDRRKQM